MPIKKLTDKTQADGAQTITYDKQAGEHLKYNRHQIQVVVKNGSGTITVPTAGTLEVKVKGPGGEATETIENGLIDLNVRDNWLQSFDGNAEQLEFVPTGLDGDKTYSVSVTSSAV